MTACTQTLRVRRRRSSESSTAKTGIHIGARRTTAPPATSSGAPSRDGVEDFRQARPGAKSTTRSTAVPDDEQGRLIAAEVSKEVDAIVVGISLPWMLPGPIEAAEEAGVPVIVISSAPTTGRTLGPSASSARTRPSRKTVAGEAMKDAGATKILCINITQVIQAVDDRCTGAEDGFGGPVEQPSASTSATWLERSPQCRRKLAEDTSIDGRRSPSVAASTRPVGTPSSSPVPQPSTGPRRQRRHQRRPRGRRPALRHRPAAVHPGVPGRRLGSLLASKPAHRRRRRPDPQRPSAAHPRQRRLGPLPHPGRSGPPPSRSSPGSPNPRAAGRRPASPASEPPTPTAPEST